MFLVLFHLSIYEFTVFLSVSISNCYKEKEASVVFRRLTEISEYERPAGRPWSRGCEAYISAGDP